MSVMKKNGHQPSELEIARKRRAARGPGRPSKLTPERKEKILQAVQAGNYFSTACEYADVDPGTAHNWVRRGEGRDPDHEPTEPYIEFSRELRRARAVAEMHKVAIISVAAGEHWQAAAWWLERMFPERFSLHNRSTVSVEMKAEVEHIIPPPRSGEHLIELVRLARELGIVTEDAIDLPPEDVIDLPALEEAPPDG
jgi:transposase-like protein